MPLETKDFVILSKYEYNTLVRDSRILAALHAGGVDNWDWYSDSINQHYPEAFSEEP